VFMNPKPISNSRLTLLRKLHQKKYRQQEQLFLVEGGRAVEQIIKNDQLSIQELFFDAAQNYWKQAQWKTAAVTVDFSSVEPSNFAEISDTDNPQGVIALCEMPAELPPEQMADQTGLVLATDAIQDPGNLGTIIRTASWFGVKGLLSGKGTVDLFHPKVVRSTAGATGTVPHANVELKEALSIFEKKGWQIVLLDSSSESIPLKEVKRQEKTLIIVGNEANGIDQSLVGSDRLKARIASPRKGGNVESLNAAIATSIALYALG